MMNPAILAGLGAKHGLTIVERSDVELAGYEVCWDGWPVFTGVTRADAQLLRSLILIRLANPKITSSYFACD